MEYTKFLMDQGISFFAVAAIEEAIQLRKAGIKEDILMLSSTAIKEDVETLVQNNIIITIGSKEDVEIAKQVGKEQYCILLAWELTLHLYFSFNIDYNRLLLSKRMNEPFSVC